MAIGTVLILFLSFPAMRITVAGKVDLYRCLAAMAGKAFPGLVTGRTFVLILSCESCVTGLLKASLVVRGRMEDFGIRVAGGAFFGRFFIIMTNETIFHFRNGPFELPRLFFLKSRMAFQAACIVFNMVGMEKMEIPYLFCFRVRFRMSMAEGANLFRYLFFMTRCACR